MYRLPFPAMSGCGRAFELVTAAAQPWSVVLPVLLLFLLQLFPRQKHLLKATAYCVIDRTGISS